MTEPYWKLKGFCMAVLYLVPTRQVRALIPSPLEISEVAPGLTLGGLYAARYGKGGPEAASEFGLLPAYVNYGGKKGFYMHNFCVDNEDPRHCGRRILTTDRALSEFSWDIGEKHIKLDVFSGGTPVVTIRMRPIISKTPLTASFPILCVKGNNVVFLKNNYAANFGVSSSTVSVPAGSPLSGFPLKMKLISTFWDASNIILKEPEYVHEGALKRADEALGNPIGRQM